MKSSKVLIEESETFAPPANFSDSGTEPIPEPMSSVDRAWLEMDDPHNPMVVSAILEFERVADVQDLARNLVSRLVRQVRFRQRVIEAAGGRAWIEDDVLHLGYHVQLRHLADPASDVELRAAIAVELGRGLDRALPLWRINLFPHGKGRVTALFRAHHAIADGVALMQLLLQLTDGSQPDHAGPPPATAARHHGPLNGFIQRLETVNSALENLTGIVVDDLRHPGQFTQQVSEVRRTLAAIGRVVTLPNDNPPRFCIPPGGRRAVAWTGNLSFMAVRKFARSQGVTINDVFLAALAGAFGRYLRVLDGKVPEEQNLRVSVPVNLRADGDGTLGNCFGLLLLDLPVGLEGWHARLDVISDRMASLKKSTEARAVLIALAAAGHLPVAAEKQLVNLIGGKAAAVVSNLPGPRRALTLHGARLTNVVFWPPQAARVGIGVSLLSYAGRVTVGVSADTTQIAHPQQLIDAFCAELQSMLGRHPAIRMVGPRRRPSSTARSLTGVNHVKT